MCVASSPPRRVAIIGAGVAGLQTARALQKAGLEFVIFEREDEIGGVWRSNYAGFGTQVRWGWYEFPELPWPEEIIRTAKAKGVGYPQGELVQQYIHAYAKKFDLNPHVRLRTPLQSVVRNKSGTWTLTTAAGSVGDFDYVISATGVYNKPFIPPTPGSTTFEGKQITSPEFTSAELARDQNVVVVGAGKSALDIAFAASTVAKSVTIIQRKVHWPLAPLIGGIIPYEWAAYARLAAFSPAYYTAAPVPTKLLHAIFTPVKWLVWRVVEILLRIQFRLVGPLSPTVNIERSVFHGGQIFPEKSFFDAVHKKRITPLKGVEVANLGQHSVQTTGGHSLQADLLIWSTGYTKTYDWLDPDTRSRLDLNSDGLYLYRNMIPVGVPGLAFVGSEVTTYNNIATSGLQAEWIAHLLAGRLQLPEDAVLIKDIERQKAWRRSFIPDSPQRAGKYQLFGNQYHDQLVRDLGASPYRRLFPTLGLAELIWPTRASDYRTLVSSWWPKKELQQDNVQRAVVTKLAEPLV